MQMVPEDNPSEIARMRARLEQEEHLSQLMRSGLTYGVARHDFINARMKHISNVFEERTKVVGEDQAYEEAIAKMNAFVGEVAALPIDDETTSNTDEQQEKLWFYIVTSTENNKSRHDVKIKIYCVKTYSSLPKIH